MVFHKKFMCEIAYYRDFSLMKYSVKTSATVS